MNRLHQERMEVMKGDKPKKPFSHKGNEKKPPPKKKKCTKSTEKIKTSTKNISPLLIKEVISGNIAVYKDELTTLFQTSNSLSFGTVSIFYGNGSKNLDVLINGELSFTLKQGQTRSQTVFNLEKVAVKCCDGDDVSTGRYCINLHYEQPNHKSNKDIMLHNEKKQNNPKTD